MKRYLPAVLCAAAALAMPAAHAQSEYEISLEIVNEGVMDDLDVLAAYMDTATDGAQAGRGIRKNAGGLADEIAMLADGRLDDYGVLTLDDGSTRQLIDGDAVTLKLLKPGPIYHRARITYCYFFDNGDAAGKRKRGFHKFPAVIYNGGHGKGLRLPGGVVRNHTTAKCGL